MELLTAFVDIVLHLDRHLAWLVANYGAWIYAILFLVIFCETGLVVTPFLPGDSLLFVAGALAATGGMDVATLIAVLALYLRDTFAVTEQTIGFFYPVFGVVGVVMRVSPVA